VTKEITQVQVAMVQQDSHGVIVAFDKDISLSREQTEEAIKHHEELLKKAKDQKIKILVFVTDLAAKNAATRKCTALICPGETRWNSYYYCFDIAIYSNNTNKDNIETFLEDLDNESEADEIEDEDIMQQVIEK
ncbi:19118_t:CDS:2, partial [Racocetra persica]